MSSRSPEPGMWALSQVGLTSDPWANGGVCCGGLTRGFMSSGPCGANGQPVLSAAACPLCVYVGVGGGEYVRRWASGQDLDIRSSDLGHLQGWVDGDNCRLQMEGLGHPSPQGHFPSGNSPSALPDLLAHLTCWQPLLGAGVCSGTQFCAPLTQKAHFRYFFGPERGPSPGEPASGGWLGSSWALLLTSKQGLGGVGPS